MEHIESRGDYKEPTDFHNEVGTGNHHDKALDALGDERVVMTDEQVSLPEPRNTQCARNKTFALSSPHNAVLG
jgi:hypothetical protein